MSRVAAYDIGTNTVRLLVAEAGEPGQPVEVLRTNRVVRLGEGVDRNHRFLDEAIERAVAGLGELAGLAGSAEAADAVATSATRDAENRNAFLDRAEQVLGVRPRVIPGEEEARLSFLGATGGGSQSQVSVIDVGGGSTEVVVGSDRPEQAISLQIGSIRLTERVLPDRPTDRVDAALAWAAERFSDIRFEVPTEAIGVAGTFTALAAIDLGLDAYADGAVHGHELTSDAMEQLVASLAAMTIEETAAIPSLHPSRAPMLLGGAVTVLAAMRHLGLDAVEVRVTDILDGVADELLRRLHPARHRIWPPGA